MKITALLNNCNNINQKLGQLDPEITNIEFDSRRVMGGTLFFALKGIHTDGHKYIDKAINLGAKAICHSDNLDNYNPNIVYIKVENTKEALSSFSAAFYSYPSMELKVIGVTGTDGKSTTVSLAYQMLTLLKKNVGFISTISFKSGDIENSNVLRQSTPEANQIHGILREMINNGKEYAIIESTSHGLSNKTCRLKDVEFNAGILTNITQEHLEFHGTLEQYRSDKGNLFRKLSTTTKELTFGVVNLDDPESENFIKYASGKNCYTYSIKNDNADMFATDLSLDASGSSFTLIFKNKQYSTRLNLPGIFNIENLMGTLLTVIYITDKSVDDIINTVPQLKSVKGRLNPVKHNGDFSVVVDYAHTPGSFKKVLPAIKKSIPENGRLIVVFGSAGERDTQKRSVQGEIADEFSDIIILTDEDPRLEDSLKIINDIKSGISNRSEEELYIISDRTKAITKAIEIARKNDMILTLGKGHETSIEYADGSKPWNEIEVVKNILKSKGLL
ncbi:MAG: UDP-N-acetylmuramoyl-L-alanyl-D-glutamate--2,6-diaminopimelate ligase [Spirochaetaceae bacterium]